MPTSERKGDRRKPRGNENYYVDEHGEKQDDGLHDDMLGNHPGAHETGIEMARKSGLTEAQIKKFYSHKNK